MQNVLGSFDTFHDTKFVHESTFVTLEITCEARFSFVILTKFVLRSILSCYVKQKQIFVTVEKRLVTLANLSRINDTT